MKNTETKSNSFPQTQVKRRGNKNHNNPLKSEKEAALAVKEVQQTIEAALREEFTPEVLVGKIRELMACGIPQVEAKMVELTLHYTEGKPVARQIVEHKRTLNLETMNESIARSPAVRRGLERMLSNSKVIEVTAENA